MRVRGWTVALLLAGTLFGTQGCFLADFQRGVEANVYRRRIEYPDKVASAKGPDFGDTYLRIRNSKGDAGSFGFVTSPFDLWGPFRWEVTAGNFDPETTNVGPGFFCTELDERGSSPLVFFSLCAQPTGGGLNVFAARNGNSNLGSSFFPGASVIELAVEFDGEDIVFQARTPGSFSWTTIASVSHSQSAALVPSLGAAQMPVGTEVNFDGFRMAFNGPLPEGATAEQGAARQVQDAAAAIMEAAHAVDGPFPSTAAVDAALAATEAPLASALAAVEALTQTKATKKAAKKVKSMQKNVGRARKSIAKEKTLKGITKSLLKAVSDAYYAVNYLDPHTLP